MFDSRLNPNNTSCEGLTARESQIVKLLMGGLTDREIAAQLVIAYTTVKWYNRQIFNKLGVNSRRDAIERVQEMGLFGATDEGAASIRHNLPAQTTPFVGRSKELAQLRHLLDHDTSRLITILAPGGMGKTRLALVAAHQQLLRHADGVFFVPLVALKSPDDIITSIAEQTGYRFQHDQRRPLQQLLDFLSDKHMLLVLDSYEHLLDGATLVHAILEAAPHLQVLVTSRERLNLVGETVFVLGGLSFPPKLCEVPLDYSAVQLFVKCAQRMRPDYELTHAEHIIRICQLLEGMPLAIELAAAWLEVLTPGEIADEIARSLDFLCTSMRDVPERQRSMRAVFDSSWVRLAAVEQTAFMKLSVFQGGCTRRAALTVAGVDLPVLSRLTDQALVKWLPEEERYAIHELLRQYAAEKLEQSGLDEAIRAAHAVYYATQIALRETDLEGADQVEALRDIAADLENVKTGFIWSVDHQQFATARQYIGSLGLFFYMRGRFYEGIEWLTTFVDGLQNQEDADARALFGRILTHIGILRLYGWENERALPLLRQALEIAREQNDRRQIAICLPRLAGAEAPTHRERAMEHCQESIAICRELDDKYLMGYAQHFLGYLARISGDLEECYHRTLEAVRLRREIGDNAGLARSLVNLSDHAQTQGWWDLAEQYSLECSVLCQSLEDLTVFSVNACNQVAQSFHKGDFDQANERIKAGLKVARAFRFRSDVEIFLFEASLLCLLKGNYTQALQLALQALEEGKLFISDERQFERCYPFIATGCAYIGLDDWESAGSQLRQGASWAPLGPADNICERFVLVGFAALFDHEGQPDRAVELLSLAVNHPLSPPWWSAREPLTRSLMERLQKTLTSEAYDAAWARGKMLDLGSVITAMSSSE